MAIYDRFIPCQFATTIRRSKNIPFSSECKVASWLPKFHDDNEFTPCVMLSDISKDNLSSYPRVTNQGKR